MHTVPLYVTDVTGATVGIEREGLRAICPGSRFEKGWWRWWHVQENGKYLVEKREYSSHCNPAQCVLSFQIAFVKVLRARLETSESVSVTWENCSFRAKAPSCG